MILRLQSFFAGLLAVLTAALLALGAAQAKPASGGYQLFEPVALEHQHAIQLASLGNFDYHAKVASECCNAPNKGSQIALNRQNGAVFENQVVDALSHVGGVKNGTPVTVTLPNGKQVTTIPDLWGRNTGGILEVKNVQDLSNSNQLRAQLQLAEETGTPFNLVVSPRTQNISGPLRDRIDEVTSKVGGGIYRYDPSTGDLSNF
ncbi:hypothetical protein RKLH11_3957 [Rhodobacteraceae bacterium KLH11]|nr:hypothetical protein RKLH11_3957 [Rhodobacteraceae bacterium KLH11]